MNGIEPEGLSWIEAFDMIPHLLAGRRMCLFKEFRGYAIDEIEGTTGHLEALVASGKIKRAEADG